MILGYEVLVASTTAGVGLYVRVSSHDQKPDLERQVARLSTWAARQGQHVVRVEEEIASGMNVICGRVPRSCAVL
jgi:predicted site-specific integrase-resolvase